MHGGLFVPVDEIQLAVLALAEGDDLHRGIGDFLVPGDLFAVVPQGPDFAGLVVAVDVGSRELRQALAVVHKAAGDRGGLTVMMSDDGGRDRRGTGAALGEQNIVPFRRAPTVIAASFDEMDLLPLLPAHIAAPEVACGPVKTHFPRVAQPVGIDFGPRLRRCEKRIAGGDAIGLAAVRVVHVDAQDVAEQVAEVLPGDQWIGRRRNFAVPGGKVEQAVIAEGDRSAVVPATAPGEQHLLTSRINGERALLLHPEPRQARTVIELVAVRVGDENLLVLLEPRMKRHAVSVIQRRVQCQQIQRHRGLSRAEVIRHHHDFAAILHEEPLVEPGDWHHVQRFRQRHLREHLLSDEGLGRLRRSVQA